MPRTTRISGTPRPPLRPGVEIVGGRELDRPFQHKKIAEMNQKFEDARLKQAMEAERQDLIEKEKALDRKRIMGLVARKRRARRK